MISDDPPINLHLFIQGRHEDVQLLVTKEHFPKVKAAVCEILKEVDTKRSRLELNFPSPSDYAKTIVAKKGICDHRFFSDLHVGLQVRAFGNFMTSMKSEEVVESKYCRVASTLMLSMSGAFDSEKERIKAFKEKIQGLGQMFRLETAEGPRYRTDCTVKVEGRPLSNWEFNNEFFHNSTCPVSQNNAYFVHLNKEYDSSSPMLLVSVVGCHYLQVFGATWNGHKCVCIDPLCSPISLLFVPRDPNDGVLKLARLLSVMDKTMGELTKEDGIDARGPYWTYNGRLKYNKNLKSLSWLFEATLDGKDEVVVKFVRHHYGEAVHKCLADAGFAPKLIDCCLLPGGWYAVVMEKLNGHSIFTTTVSESDIKRSLRTAVELMHGNNYVHGDLRPQNFLIVDRSIRVLDFDWADKENTATYPPELNENSAWHHEVCPGGEIRKAHDMHLINSISWE